MIALLPFLLQWAEPAINTDRAVSPPSRTAESLTRPLYRISCDLIDGQINRYALVLNQKGGQGYWEQTADGEKVARQTPISFTVERDTTGHFGDRVVRGEWVDEYFVHRALASRGGDIYEGDPWTLRFEVVTDERYAVTISDKAELHRKYVGFCSMDKRSQGPLG